MFVELCVKRVDESILFLRLFGQKVILNQLMSSVPDVVLVVGQLRDRGPARQAGRLRPVIRVYVCEEIFTAEFVVGLTE